MEEKGRKGCGWRGSGCVEVAIMKWRNEASKARQSGRTVSQTDRQPAPSSSAPFFSLCCCPLPASFTPRTRPHAHLPACLPASFRSSSLPPPRFFSLRPAPSLPRLRKTITDALVSSPLLRLLALSSSPRARLPPDLGGLGGFLSHRIRRSIAISEAVDENWNRD